MAQHDDTETLVRKRQHPLLGHLVRPRIGGQRIGPAGLVGDDVRFLKPVDAARGRQDVAPHSGSFRKARGADAGVPIDAERRVLKQLAGRVVGYGNKIDDGVDTLEVFGGEFSTIFDDHVEAVTLRQEMTAEKKSVDRSDGVSLTQQQWDQNGADVSARARHQDRFDCFLHLRL